jgi:hypothetical protein
MFLGHVLTSLEAPPGKLPTEPDAVIGKKSRCDCLKAVPMM